MRDLLRVNPARGFSLAKIDPSGTPGISKKDAKAQRKRDRGQLRALQERLYAEGKRSLLVVLQGTDTSGKDGTIIHVFGAVDPQGVQITGFKAPNAVERKHDFLWRIRRALPMPGRIGIFNRSQYEDVLIARVDKLVSKAVWSKLTRWSGPANSRAARSTVSALAAAPRPTSQTTNSPAWACSRSRRRSWLT